MLFFCMDDSQLHIECTLDGASSNHAEAPAPGAHWEYNLTGGSTPLPEAVVAGGGGPGFTVIDPNTGLDYRVFT